MIEPDPPQVKVEPVGGASRRVAAVVGLIAVVLGIAIWKPWGSSPPSPPPPPVKQVAVTDTQAPTAVPISLPPATPGGPADIAAARGRMLCGDEPQWRLLTMETGSLGVIRTVYSTTPAAASGPDDAAIPTVPVMGAQLLGIGVCRPGELASQGATPVTGVTIWRVPAGGGASAVGGLTTIDADLARVGEAYYRPDATEAPQPTGSSPDWTPGRYVVEISATNSHDEALWFALDFSNIEGSTGVFGQ